MDVHALIAAREEFKPRDPEGCKIFLPGLFAGMRRAEIDLAQWRMVDWRNCVIKLEETEWPHLRTPDSAGEITVDEEVTAELRVKLRLLPESKAHVKVSVGAGR